MSDAEFLVRRLRRLLPVVEENAEEFSDLVGDMVSSGDAACIGPLLDVAEDNFPLGGVMELLLGSLWDFGAELYVPELVARLPELSRRAPEWSGFALTGFLGEGAYRDLLVAELRDAGEEERRVAWERLAELREEDPDLADACGYVIGRVVD